MFKCSIVYGAHSPTYTHPKPILLKEPFKRTVCATFSIIDNVIKQFFSGIILLPLPFF